MNEYTKLNKSKVLLYQMQVPLNFLLPIFFPLGSGDDGDSGEVNQQGGQSFPEQALWRGHMVDNLNVYFYV